ncbi:GNAT family N-acetyltransferase [Desulfopila aestuarii]|uniref:Ribosomal protein S18 acetylase RimI n=1 Tax=Desulfopila aestuarii DSM 18488 TaxID=1121416 RepID=A0A1M7XYK7_9BACT|nr:GNAT family N-acetyltransferase [Desulfopila aestuarii]SHO44102.1 Ribosomal protein S18 acetylase RimI [Desulfopila aestuarii DSM 18488]
MDHNTNNVSIRRWRTEDVDEICQIYNLITNKGVDADFRRMVLERAQSKGVEDGHFVAESGGKIVGFMISYILPFGFGAEDCAYIATMGVHPKYMDQGIGAGMTKEVFMFFKARGISTVYTSVRWDSTDLLSFFKTMGFERSNFINLKKTLD